MLAYLATPLQELVIYLLHCTLPLALLRDVFDLVASKLTPPKQSEITNKNI
jgi:hypothetical protein